MPGISVEQFRKELKKQLPGPRLKGQAFKVGLDAFHDVKNDWLKNDFDAHPVTQELNEGNTAVHTMGVLTKGNLFSFLGFSEGATPAKDVRLFLDENIRIRKLPNVTVEPTAFYYRFPVEMPDKTFVYKSFPLEWNSGRSWIEELEEGITGLSHYIFKLFFSYGRSKTGLQSKHKVRAQPKAARVDYITGLLKKLEDILKK